MSERKGVAKNPSKSEVQKCNIQVFGTHMEVFSSEKLDQNPKTWALTSTLSSKCQTFELRSASFHISTKRLLQGTYPLFFSAPSKQNALIQPG